MDAIEGNDDSPIDPQLDSLVRDHAHALYRLARSIVRDEALAEDVVQETLLKAWLSRSEFRRDAPVRAWLLRIAHNTAVSTLRSRRDEPWEPERLPEGPAPGDVQADVERTVAMDAFWSALEHLDPQSRSILVLREVEGFSYQEICDVLEISMPVVKSKLFRGRRKLADDLEGWTP